MLDFILKRIVQLIFVLVGVTLLTYFVTTLTPSDAAEMYYVSMGIVPTDEQLDAKRTEYGLNDPFIVQYGRWLKSAVRGDFGASLNDEETVSAKFLRRLPSTLKLTATTLIFVLIISLPLGSYTAIKQNKFIDYMIRFITFIGNAMPGFWMAMVVMLIFGVKLRWFPIVVRDNFKSMIMPMLSLGIPMICYYTRQIRTAILEELGSDYVVGLKSKGLSERKIIFRHVLPNSMPPIINLLGLSIGGLLGGATIIESIYSWPGIGSMIVTAITNRDYPVIQCYVIWMAFIYVLCNLVVDILHFLMNPELRAREKVR